MIAKTCSPVSWHKLHKRDKVTLRSGVLDLSFPSLSKESSCYTSLCVCMSNDTHTRTHTDISVHGRTSLHPTVGDVHLQRDTADLLDTSVGVVTWRTLCLLYCVQSTHLDVLDVCINLKVPNWYWYQSKWVSVIRHGLCDLVSMRPRSSARRRLYCCLPKSLCMTFLHLLTARFWLSVVPFSLSVIHILG